MSPTAAKAKAPTLRIVPLTAERWPDLERLFGVRGACGGCWCMWWRLPRREFLAGKVPGAGVKGEGNRRAFRRVVEDGEVPGLLAYEGDEPVGWVAVQPRETYPRLDRSRTLARVDDRPVWSITCFYVARSHRRRGVARALAAASLRHARERGARIVEAYPVDSAKRSADPFVYTGPAATFEGLGFREVARRSRTRPILRRAVRP